MRFSDQYRFVRQNMKKNRTRIFMTVLATAMGCAFLIVLASVAFGLQKSVVEEITEDQLLTEISIYAREDGNEHRPLTKEDVAYLEGVKNVKSVLGQKVLPYSVNVEEDDFISQVRIIGTSPEAEQKAGFELEAGERQQADGEVVIGYHLAQSLASHRGIDLEGMIGSEIVIGIQPKLTEEMIESGEQPETPEEAKTILTVTGITEAPTQEWRENWNLYLMYSDYDRMIQLQNTYGEEVEEANMLYFDDVKVYAEDAEDVKGIAKKIRAEGYLNHSIADQMEQVNVFFLVMKIGLILVGTIALLIASIGIYNTMTMAVTERSQDIGIMKAIGMHPSKIKSIFLIESSYIGLMGAFIGTVTAYIVGYAANMALPVIVRTFMDDALPEGLQISYIPLSLTVLCVSISVGVAVLSGLRPAVRATRVDVLKALRRDV